MVMKRESLIVFLFFLSCLCQAQNKYELTIDSKRKAGVEYGEDRKSVV